MENCMFYAVEYNVENLKIRAHTERPMVMPRAMVESTSIVSLRLTNGVANSLLLPKSFALLKLKILQLKRFIFSHRNYDGELLLGCPVVEVLVLSHCRMTRCSKLKVLEVNSSSLKKLVIKNWSSPYKCFMKHMINVSAPNLVEFKLQGHIVRLNFNEPCLHVAWFDVRNPSGELLTSKRENRIAQSLFDLLDQITHYTNKRLFLSFDSLWVL
ncbi:UNVERIFIED_CONTAM: hypothetical protein Slati_2879900 [Sesamum latifolium]|uniref:F-box/LRR-repeat protein 15/At3g58940/PEG3-like LRR domain-containing protein n=1 Tax=Sesamum latifolium TaxID=2727402 RepID=A0AAW2VFF5_9LAMI